MIFDKLTLAKILVSAAKTLPKRKSDLLLAKAVIADLPVEEARLELKTAEDAAIAANEAARNAVDPEE